VGSVTSGGFSPCLERGIGMGYVPPALAKNGARFGVRSGNADLVAVTTPRPFYEGAFHSKPRKPQASASEPAAREDDMAKVPDGRRYTKEHEWAKLEGDLVTVGITDWAQEQLSDVVYVELPAVGKTVRQSDAFGVIEAVKTVSDLYAPVSGEVVEVNQALADNPALVNQSPYEK